MSQDMKRMKIDINATVVPIEKSHISNFELFKDVITLLEIQNKSLQDNSDLFLAKMKTDLHEGGYMLNYIKIGKYYYFPVLSYRRIELYRYVYKDKHEWKRIEDIVIHNYTFHKGNIFISICEFIYALKFDDLGNHESIYIGKHDSVNKIRLYSFRGMLLSAGDDEIFYWPTYDDEPEFVCCHELHPDDKRNTLSFEISKESMSSISGILTSNIFLPKDIINTILTYF
jgi:hypothetical protein